MRRPGLPATLMQQSAVNGQLVYVVDDHVSITRLIALNLTAQGYQAKAFHSGYEALANLENDRPDLVLLDLVMPDCGGLEITRLIRQRSAVPIIVLSVRNETASILAALDLGADDYMTKPFRMEELLARVRAILRRTSPADAPLTNASHSYRSGGLIIDLDGMKVTSHQRNVSLTPREWATLRTLLKNVGAIVTPQKLLDENDGKRNGGDGDNARTYIARLRRKLEPNPRNPRYILLERGLGYRLVDAD